jgi:hypothetical protein
MIAYFGGVVKCHPAFSQTRSRWKRDESFRVSRGRP